MENIEDLLTEVSRLSKYTDKQIVDFDRRYKYTYDEIYPMWKDHYDNFIGKATIAKKYGIQHQTFMRYCGHYNLPLRSYQEMKDAGICAKNAALGAAKVNGNILEKPANIDILNGTTITDWCQKYKKTDGAYRNRKRRLKKHGALI